MNDEQRETISEMTDQAWAVWRHHPLTKAFFTFLEDQRLHWRDLAADLLESGAFTAHDPHEDKNPDVVRGKLACLKELAGIDRQQLQSFYGLDSDQSTVVEEQHEEL